MTIKIVTDSACDLPQELIEKFDITVVPLYINIGEESYLDQVDLSREDFYNNLSQYSPFPQTAAPGPGKFKILYDDLAQKGADEIISIHISRKLSSTIESARLGAEQCTSVPVTVVDSNQLSLGAGFVVLAAAEAAAEGKSKEEILQAIEDRIGCTHVFAAVETIDYLERSGRMNVVLARLASALQIKPLLKMYQGIASAERVRTEKRSLERLVQLVRELGPLQQLALVHTNAPDKAEKLHQMALELFPNQAPPLVVGVTPVLGAHLGPGTVGFAVIATCKRQLSWRERIDEHLPVH